MSRIIDMHSHFMPPAVAEQTTFFKVQWSDLDRQLNLMDEQGIDQAVLLYPTSDAHLNMGGWRKLAVVYNEGIADAVCRAKDRFVGAAILPFNDPQGRDDELKRMMDKNLRVISLASSYEGRYLDDEYFFPVFEFAQKYKIPIHVHAQIMSPIGEERVRDPLLTPVLEYVMDVSMTLGKMMMAGVFARYQGVKFIFAHYGGVLPIVKDRFDTTYQMLRQRGIVKDLGCLPGEVFAKIYFDTSGSSSSATLAAALEVVDSSHILFGSDFPANRNLGSSLKVVRQSHLKPQDQEKILGSNFLELIK